MVTAVTPAEIGSLKAKLLPGHVIETWNALLAQKSTGGPIRITQNEAIEELQVNCPELISRQGIFDSGWLDIEPVYRAAGWSVKYDKPAYCESYEAYYIFTPK